MKEKEKNFLKSLIKKTCRERLDKYKIPVIILFDELKITNRGKKNEK